MSLLKKIAIGLLCCVVLIAIIGFFILPAVIKPIAVEKLAAYLHRPVAIEKINVNPYALSVTIKGFKISEPALSPNSFAAFDELYVNLHGVYSLFQRKLILEEIKLVKPYVGITRNEDGSYNFSDLLPQEETPAAKSEPFYFSFNNIQITGGNIDFNDVPNKIKHTVRDMNLAVPVISNIEHHAKSYVEPKFSAVINGDPFVLQGKTKPFQDSRETSFDLEINDLDIPHYLKYIPAKLNFNLQSAFLDTKLKINFIMQKDKEPQVKISGDIGLRKIVLDDLQNKRILNLPQLKIAVAAAEPLNNDIHLARITARDIELFIKRNKNGEINLLNLTETQKQKKKEPEESNNKAPEQQKKPLQLRLDELQLSATNLIFTDDMPERRAVIRIAPLNFKAKNLSLEKEAKGDIDLLLTLEKKGQIALKGRLGIEPLAADLNVAVKNLPIRPFQPYFTDKIKVNVRQGAVSTEGKFLLAGAEKDVPRVKYDGRLYVSHLAVVDESHSNDFLQWKQLYFESLKASYNPFFLDIKGISLTDFYVRVIVNTDGTLNLQNIFGTEKKEVREEKATAEATVKEDKKATVAKEDDTTRKIKIGAVTFQGGTIDFSDHFIKPNYSVRMLNIAGHVKGLASEEDARADVHLKGNLGYGSPIEIKGKINPLKKDIFADVKVDFRDIELSPATPYSSKYLGHPITKGKLTFAVEYLVDKRKLDAKNNILIDQLMLGDKVESPDAVKAPVSLAVSLLTDRKGQINLDIPLSGSLDDPEFSILPILWKVLVNLITKALTSPFALLASLTGGGEELSFVEFDYGSTIVTDPNLKKINTLIKALKERPQLKMDIQGFVDPEKDKNGLQAREMEKKIKAQKMKELAEKDEAKTLDSVQIEPGEYEKYLMLAYNAAKFPQPRTEKGELKKMTKDDMEKLLLTSITITDSDLRQLAARRTENVRELILKSGEVPPARIFIIEPKTLAAEQKEKVKASRVDFRLK
ncbi:MAG TPA: DUF748 domain-containing protein [Smithellaceae bacterium]|nr:DUF748 domain-containing protein [Smithellaceae bacterium]